jgi:hypothetical protein
MRSLGMQGYLGIQKCSSMTSVMRNEMKTLLLAFIMCFPIFKSHAFTPEETVAITILAEARGEGKSGMYAVACVISQRAKERKKSAAQVCLQPWQFSCWNKNDPQKATFKKAFAA